MEPLKHMKFVNTKKHRFLIALMLIVATFTLSACESKINTININGTYYGVGTMQFEAVVEAGTITIYNTSFFRKEVYWYGTCHQNELDKENKLMSERLEHESNRRRSFFDIGGLNESRASKREILFTEDSLTFVYDFSGMAMNQVTLYKDTAKKKRSNDSNADQIPETETYPYIEPSQERPTNPAPFDPNQSDLNDEEIYPNL